MVALCRQTLVDVGLQGRVLAADMTQTSPAYHLADAGFYATRFDDPSFIPLMLGVCREQGVKLLIPTHDRELALYAQTAEQFAAIGTCVNISAKRVIDIGSDKVATHRFLVEHGFPTPAQAMALDVARDTGDWVFPAIVKPRGGSASIGVTRVNDAAALRRLAPGADDLIQTVAPGIEHTVDVFVDRAGQCRCAVPRRRLEVRSGEVSKGVTVRDPRVVGLAIAVAEALPGARGVLNIQIFADTDTLNVIEINPRFGGGYPLSHEAGANMVRWLIEEHTSGACSASHDAWADGRVMLRYDAAVFVNKTEAGLG